LHHLGHIVLLFFLLLQATLGYGQCTAYTITVEGNDADETSWQLFNSANVLVASGSDEDIISVCLPDDCYTLFMYDSNGDGWENTNWIIADLTGDFDFDTNLPDGFSGADDFELGTANCGGGGGCASGTLNIDVDINPGANPEEILWTLSSNGIQLASGNELGENNLCLAPGCYELALFDQGGNGWQGGTFSIDDNNGNVYASGTLSSGFSSTIIVSIAGADCTGIGNNGCSPGTAYYDFYIVGGSQPEEVTWEISQNGIVLYSGGAPFTQGICLAPGCYDFNMFDSGGDGWVDAYYSLVDVNGIEILYDFLMDGFSGTHTWLLGVADCTPPGDIAIPGGDCSQAIPVCDPFTFQITPSGFGAFQEIPVAGSISNPSFFGTPPWGGSHTGCLLAGELNSSWLLITIATTGNLAFTLGASGTQLGFYDWAMWPYTAATCAGIANNTLPPARCVWNAASFGGTGLANTVPAGAVPGNYAPELPVIAGQSYLICFSNYSFLTTQVLLDFFGSATVSCSPLVLPVEFLSIQGTASGEVHWIEWETISENENAGFVLQRSTGLEQWTDIASTNGQGFSQQLQQYSLPDRHAYAGVLYYYRIKQMDFNGLFQYSSTVDVIHYSSTAQLFPNPADVSFTCLAQDDFIQKIKVKDSSGRMVYDTELLPALRQTFSCENWPNGIYVVQLFDGQKWKAHKLMVQH
jgi:hypothetical protein